MLENENISSMYARFNDIINALKGLGKVYTNHELVSKILRCLPKSWEPKVTAIEEAKNLSTLLEKDEKGVICYECDKLGHIRPDCPKLKKKKDKVKKKAMIATWSDSDDSSSDDEENEEIANIAFMAMEDDCEVNTSSLSYNELQCEYDELLDVLNDLNREYLLLKKIAKDRAKENVKLKNCILELKKDLGMIEKNSSLEKENLDLKTEIDALKKTFSKFSSSNDKLDKLLGMQRCVFDRARLGFDEMNKVKHFDKLLDRKKKVMNCNFCEKIGHISSTFWYRRSNAKIKRIWVPKGIFPSNTKGPKTIWVPKT
ncbi:zf-CCHC domain-containing protein/UBN2 domain-containing protein [Cephalotus follicularis]|uniref:Zf-CCHC domain-containing protein/UBN2 domain-containing protein n=1 Tax=Cephalotus follicularis TaxID=3775 RepID=A0A1Q3CI39_CEPFO|nr:zf-CCHC domain-containing protein/UBN2 domain-containing protein [Cephalotus follicularis]